MISPKWFDASEFHHLRGIINQRHVAINVRYGGYRLHNSVLHQLIWHCGLGGVTLHNL